MLMPNPTLPLLRVAAGMKAGENSGCILVDTKKDGIGEPAQQCATHAKLRERTAVEHTLAHISQWQGRDARYIGQRKNLFDLRRTAAVHNLHVLMRQPQPTDEAAA